MSLKTFDILCSTHIYIILKPRGKIIILYFPSHSTEPNSLKDFFQTIRISLVLFRPELYWAPLAYPALEQDVGRDWLLDESGKSKWVAEVRRIWVHYRLNGLIDLIDLPVNVTPMSFSSLKMLFIWASCSDQKYRAPGRCCINQ